LDIQPTVLEPVKVSTTLKQAIQQKIEAQRPRTARLVKEFGTVRTSPGTAPSALRDRTAEVGDHPDAREVG
jgi:hypothetical protein